MNWITLPPENPEIIKKIRSEVYDNEIIAKLLVQRNIHDIESAKNFFRPDIKNLHDPFLMKDMSKAVERIEQAIKKQEKILVYGDYDVDGTTAVAMMYSFLKKRYKNVHAYIPDRYTEGYGISFESINYAKTENCKLIIALDCGIKAVDKVKYANEKNIDFIICDHHTPGETLPKAIAILDPKRKDDTYPDKNLSGCAVGFKLISAYSKKNGIPFSDLYKYLDLVAVSIGADIVPIVGENRILTYYGLKILNSSPRHGFKVIMQQYKIPEFTITDVVFKIAPRINAAGRMKHGKYAVRLMILENEQDAILQYEKIELYNKNRKIVDKDITEQAIKQIVDSGEEKKYTSVVYNENWHKGVIGIVASRLIESYYRPTVVFTKTGENKLAASVRSVKGFDVYEALKSCEQYIEQFGGHKYAAGLTIYEENYTNFKTKFEEVVKKTITNNSLHPEIIISSEIDIKQINKKFYSILKQLAPFGPNNMHPIFASKNLKDNGYAKKIGEKNNHLKINVYQNDDKNTISGIGFELGKKWDSIKDKDSFEAAFTIEENHWQGQTNLQLNIRDIK